MSGFENSFNEIPFHQSRQARGPCRAKAHLVLKSDTKACTLIHKKRSYFSVPQHLILFIINILSSIIPSFHHHLQIEALTDENCQLSKKLEVTLGKLEVVCFNYIISHSFYIFTLIDGAFYLILVVQYDMTGGHGKLLLNIWSSITFTSKINCKMKKKNV